MKNKKKDISLACGCALLPLGGFGFSYFVFDCGFKKCVVAVLLSFAAAILVLAVYIWRMEKREN